MFSDSFTGDATGAFDPCTVPERASGARVLRLTPPAGHAWSYKLGSLGATTIPKTTDEPLVINGPFVTGEDILYVALDSGSGSFLREWLN